MLLASLLRSSTGSAWRDRLHGLVRLLHLGALVLALALSPSTYRPPWRAPLAAQVVRAALPLLLWFTVLAALVSVVLTRIVLVTAMSYGLSQLALEMVVRVLVLELIPLSAALAVALRVSMPLAGELAALRLHGGMERLRSAGQDPLRGEIAPRMLAAFFCVLLLAALAGVVALVLAYLMAHGFSPWAFERYTRMVGQIFNPAVLLVFVLKTGALALGVSLLPMGTALHGQPRGKGLAGLELQGLTRLLLAALLVEVAALAGNYL